MPVDPNIAANINPFQRFMQMEQLQALTNQNTLFQQQFQAKQAMGQIIQQSIVPGTNQIDYNKAFVGLSTNPLTAPIAMDWLKSLKEREKIDTEIMGNKLKAEQTRLELIGSKAAELLANPNVGVPDYTDAIADLYSKEAIGKSDVLKFSSMLNLPPTQLKDRLRGMTAAATKGKESIEIALGTLERVDTGPESIYMRTLPGQPPRPVATMTKGLSPAEALRPVEVVGPGGEKRLRTQEQLTGLYPTGGMATPLGGRIAELGGPALGGLPMGQGGAEAGAEAMPAPVPMAAPTTPVRRDPLAGGLGYTLQQSPKEVEEQKAQVQQATKYQERLVGKVEDARRVLMNIRDLRSLAEQIKTGGFATSRMEAARIAQGLGAPDSMVNGIANGDLAASQAFQKKVVEMAMNNLRQALGGQGRITEMEFNKFEKANANLELTPEAVTRILGFMEKMAKFDRDEMQVLAKYRKAHKDFDVVEFQSWYDNLLDKSGRLKELRSVGGIK